MTKQLEKELDSKIECIKNFFSDKKNRTLILERQKYSQDVKEYFEECQRKIVIY
jgi:hypothetical protein